MDEGLSVQLSHVESETTGDVTIKTASGAVLVESKAFQANANTKVRHEVAPKLAAEAVKALENKALESAGTKVLLYIVMPVAVAAAAAFVLLRRRSSS